MKSTGKHKRPFFHYLGMWGAVSTGLVYFGIGLIAILSFLQIKKGGADEGSMFVYLHQFIAGRILVWIILTGMISYIVWRIYETIRDPYSYGKDLEGIAKRSIAAFSSIADGLIAFSAIQALLNSGSASKTGIPDAERELVADILSKPGGDWIIKIIAIIICLTALVQFGYVIIKGYMERLDIHHLNNDKRFVIHFLAWSGHFSRGIILGIIGVFLYKATVSGNPNEVVNTDKAFDFIGDDVGHLYFIIVALGTILYGVFMILFGIFYDSDKDYKKKKQK